MPRRSSRVQSLKRASSLAVVDVARPQRAKRPRKQATSSVVAVPASPSPTLPLGESTSAPASSGMTDELVNRISNLVTQRVTRELGSVLNIPIHEPPAPSTPVPTIQNSSVHADLIEVPATQAAPIPASGELANPFMSSSLPIDCRVTDKTKQKIWAHEYVDFGSLLINPTAPPRYKVSLDSQEAQLTLEPAEKIRKITSIDTWLTAFHVFVGVYTSKFSNEAPALMKYGSLIRDLAVRGQNWRFYDENFRFMRQTNVHSMPWSTIHTELWLRSQNSPGTFRPSNVSQQRRNASVPFGYCINYHRGNKCGPGCRYKHSCFKCSADHAAVNCNFRGVGNASNIASHTKRSSNGPQGAKSSTSPPSNSS